MPHDKLLTSMLSDDLYDRTLLGNVRPGTWENPQPARRYNLVIIGAGPAGLFAAMKAVTLGAKVALIERNLLGGACLNFGCIPSKTIISTSRLYAEMRNAENFGARVPSEINVDFPAVMERMRRARARISRSISAIELTSMGVDVYFGEASFMGIDAVMVDGKALRFKRALIATGAR